MRRINGKRIISSTMCALMIASLSMPTVATYGAEVGATQEVRGVERTTETNEYVIDGFMAQLDTKLKDLGTNTVIKCAEDMAVSDEGGTVTLPKQVTLFVGWNAGTWGGTVGKKQKQLGSYKQNQTFTFEAGSNITVDSIIFKSGVKVIVPANTTVVFEDCQFDAEMTVEENGTATFNNCTFTTGTIVAKGQVNYTGTTKNPTNTASQGAVEKDTVNDVTDLLINSPSPLSNAILKDEIASKLESKTVIRLQDNVELATNDGDSVEVPSQVTKIVGWSGQWDSVVGEKNRYVGSTEKKQTLTFATSSNLLVKMLSFRSQAQVVVPSGVTTKFEDCTFDGNVTIESGANVEFVRCTIKGALTDNAVGTKYTETDKPATVVPEVKPSVTPLILTQTANTLSEGVVGTEYNQTVTYTLTGTNAENAIVSATVTPANGLTANAVNSNGTVTVTVSGTPTGAGEFTVTTTASATDNSPVSDVAKATIIAKDVVEATELVIDDNYNSFDVQLANNLRNATTIKLANNNLTVSKPNETTTLPKQVTKLVGWQVKSFFEPEGEKVQSLGSGGADQTLTFEAGSNLTVRKIDFTKGVHVVVPKGVTVTFEDCTFGKTMTNEGTAVFNNCTFSTGQITNNGAAEYTNGTVVPENLGTEDTSAAHFPLGMDLTVATLKDGVTGQEYVAEVAYTLSGTNKDKATVTAEVVEKVSGLTAKVENGKIIVTGTPTSVMSVSVKIIAQAEGDNPIEKVLTLNTYAPFQVELAGSINCMIMPKQKAKASRHRLDAVSRATGSAGGGSSSGVILPDGSTSAQNTLTPFIITEDGTKIDWFEYSRDNKDATLETKVFPEGSGVTAECLFGTVTLKGEPLKTGEFYITVTVRDKGQEVTSNKIDFRIYRGDESLKEQLGNLKADQIFWDVEPYEIANSDRAVIPTTLKKIYGSHQSGTYAVIGNSDIDKVDTDTIVIPNGCDVTFENVKIYSSIRIIVEKGGSLTLSDSVSFGKIEVNGGTFAMGNSSAICDELILNDGSTLKGKEIKVMTPDGMVTKQGTQIKSHAHFLTDGSDKEYSPENVVIVNGTVTVDGDVEIQGDVGSGRLRGQTALCVKGDLVIPAGSTVKTLGGGAAPEDQTYMPAKFGGHGIKLQDGRILGDGSLTAVGGISYDGRAGHGITGNGDIMVGSLESTGGNATLFLPGYKVIGGDAVQQDVAVMTKPENIKLTAGKALKMDGTHIGGTANGIDGTAVISKTTPTVVRPEKPVTPDTGSNTSNNTSGGGIPFIPTAPVVTTPTVTTPSVTTEQKSDDKKNDDDKTDKKETVKKEKTKQQKDKNKNNKETKVAKKETQKESKKQEKTKDTYYKKMSGTSLVNVLKALKVDSSFASRKNIAEANGIKNYTGTAEQNAKLLELAQKGKLKQPKVVKTKKKATKTKSVKMSTKSIKKKK